MSPTCPLSDLETFACAHCRGDRLPSGWSEEILTLQVPERRLLRSERAADTPVRFFPKASRCSECEIPLPPGHYVCTTGAPECEGCAR